jgi:hypothetical protein
MTIRMTASVIVINAINVSPDLAERLPPVLTALQTPFWLENSNGRVSD